MSNALSVATYLKRSKGIYGNMQLQKLLYYSQAWNLAWTGKPLFHDEIEAWPKGPVVREVWAAEKYNEPVTASELSESEIAIVDAVYAFYGNLGGMTLGSMTHNEEPWLEARDGLGPDDRSSAAISQATMRRFFTWKATQASERAPKPPVLNHGVEGAEAVLAGDRQRQRWRGALDALAEL